MRGTLLSSSISRITKSAGKVNLPTSTSIFSAIPIGYWNDRYANIMLILVGLRFSRDSFADEVFSTWMAFGCNTCDLGSFGEEMDEITDLHQIHKEIFFSERGDGVAGIKRCRRDPSSDIVRDLVTTSRRGRLNEDLESSTLWSEDPNQHLKDFLKLVDSLDLDGENKERTRLSLFQFSLRDQASNWLERLLAGSITTWEDLTTRFLAQLFPPGRTAKLPNDFLMFQQHHGESLSEAWTRFKDLLQKVPHYGIDRWLQIQIFYDHVSFHLKCGINRVGGDKLRNKNADESWEIIENLALYDHEGWNDTKVFAKPVKAISTPQGTSKTPDQRLIEFEDQINFLLKGSRLAPTPSSTYILHAYVEAVYSNSHQQNQNKPPKLNPFAFRERTCPNPQP
ncbi:zinc finger, CCHC-type containing protein [Tanacetum coccineum]